MNEHSSLFQRATSIFGRVKARKFARRKIITALKTQPEPLSIGSAHKGHQFVSGHFMFDGHMVDEVQKSPWSCTAPSAGFEAYMHSFAWLDDVLAMPEQSARRAAQGWLLEWVESFGSAQGTGWRADVTGARVLRWLHHALALMRGLDAEKSDQFLGSLAQQSKFLERNWSRAAGAKSQFEALCGLLTAALALEGLDLSVPDLLKSLEKLAAQSLDSNGAIASRNAQELSEIAELLMWSRQAVAQAGHHWPQSLSQHISQSVHILRILRHSHGGLVRMHGSGSGVDGRLEAVLSLVKPTEDIHAQMAMGFGRLSSGRTSIIMDCAAPPMSAHAHASTLSFELGSGRRPVIVSMGHGRGQEGQWQRSCRASSGHSGVLIGGEPSSPLGEDRAGKLMLKPLVKKVSPVITRDTNETSIHAGHDGYLDRFGLIHRRTMTLSSDGNRLFGQDSFVTPDEKTKRIFGKALTKTDLGGLPIEIRYHIHPDCQAVLDAVQRVVTIELPSHEVWVFRAPINTSVRLDPGFFLSDQNISPLANKIIAVTRKINVPNIDIPWRFERVFYRKNRATRDTLGDLGPVSFLDQS